MQVDPTQSDTIVVSLFYIEEKEGLPLNDLKEIISKLFSETNVTDKNNQSHVVKLKWDIRQIDPESGAVENEDTTPAEKEKLPKKCDILSFFKVSMQGGRPDWEHQGDKLASCVSKGRLDEGGELLCLSSVTGSLTVENELMRTHVYFNLDEKEKNTMPYVLKAHHLTGCILWPAGGSKSIVEDCKSSIEKDIKYTNFQANIVALKKVVDNIVQKKFNKTSTTPPKVTPKEELSSPKEELSYGYKFSEWKKAFPNTTEGKAFQILKPLFNEFLKWSDENKSKLDSNAPTNEDQSAKFIRHLKQYKSIKPDGPSQVTTTQPSQTAVKKEPSISQPARRDETLQSNPKPAAIEAPTPVKNEPSQPSVQTTARLTKEQMLEEINKLKKQFKKDFESGRSLDLKAEIEAEEREINKLGNFNPQPTSIEAPKAQARLDFKGWSAMMGDRLDAGAPPNETGKERAARRLKMFNEYKATFNS